jgi:hypothetical protein
MGSAGGVQHSGLLGQRYSAFFNSCHTEKDAKIIKAKLQFLRGYFIIFIKLL